MSNRTDAAMRIWALLWQFTIGYVLAIVIGVVGTVWAVVDLLWQLITGGDGLSSSATPAQWVSRTLMWSAGQTIYGITGGSDGQWRALP